MPEVKIQIAAAQVDRLDRLAGKLSSTRSTLAARAIEDFLDLQDAQLADIEAAVQEADAEDFASDSEIRNVVQKYLLPATK
jgi:predicted transcriptional regulator